MQRPHRAQSAALRAKRALPIVIPRALRAAPIAGIGVQHPPTSRRQLRKWSRSTHQREAAGKIILFAGERDLTQDRLVVGPHRSSAYRPALETPTPCMA